jgi:cobalt-precorrin 5A hydrolase
LCRVRPQPGGSIDLKKDEPGLAAFCKAHGWPITFYPADELRAVPGQFTPSAFVASVTGVDNVCERSAVKASGGMLLLPKTAGGGVTLALAVRPFAPDWRTEQ